ncbi:insulinase family protein [Salinibacterium sp. SYSU T00001]|uniref:M16 family metallopeptidase n=1 Tax=Homoserinimonas sedimenticola TaxID=2986805 RepID=UPI002235E18B|nr:pitrilysin family protein [Salinibacterium sedimenticola]MCW4386752.1 insulinase family protein [Salinibacterium sedimenticola]
MNGALELPLTVGETTFAAAGECLVRRTVLPSGVRILTESVPSARSATIGFWVAVGSRDEEGSALGSTHFLEHLLFKGTSRRSALDIAVSFDEVGGEHNAATAKEYTCYYAKVRDTDVPMAVDVLADMVTSSRLDPGEFETERGVILEELAMAEDDIADFAGERFFEALFAGHPLGRPIGGNPGTISAVTRDAVHAHYRRYYAPHELVVTVAGAIDHDQLVAAVEAHLRRGGWNLSVEREPAARRRPKPPVSGESSQQVIARPSEQVNLYLGVPGLAAADERRNVLSVLSSVLGGGMSSRLFQEVRERRGLAYSVHSFASSYSDAGVLGMYAACSPGRARSVAELMLAEFRAIARDGVTQEELRRALGQLGGASALALEDSDTRMSRLGRAEITTGEFIDLDEALSRLARVTTADVAALASQLAEGPLTVTAVGRVDESLAGESLIGETALQRNEGA